MLASSPSRRLAFLRTAIRPSASYCRIQPSRKPSPRIEAVSRTPFRAFTMTIPSLADAPSSPSPSPSTLSASIDDLTTHTPWRHHPAPNPSLSRTFLFPTFKSAMAFVNRVADLAKRERHHPEWANVYNRVLVRWVTHQPRDGSPGPVVTELDVRAARECEAIAVEVGLSKRDEAIGGEPAEPAGGAAEGLEGIVCQVVGDAGGDCCKPEKKA